MYAIGEMSLAVFLTLGFVFLIPVSAIGESDVSSLEESLRATEIAFAATMAARDHAAFSSFLAEEAVFFDGDDPLRGREAVASAWAGFFAAAEPPFSWAPEVVVVLEKGRLGLTSGPVRNAAGDVIATFNSIWELEEGGAWRIVFDRGCAVGS
jgi:ketosteroid isomerase-like protein